MSDNNQGPEKPGMSLRKHFAIAAGVGLLVWLFSSNGGSNPRHPQDIGYLAFEEMARSGQITRMHQIPQQKKVVGLTQDGKLVTAGVPDGVTPYYDLVPKDNPRKYVEDFTQEAMEEPPSRMSSVLFSLLPAFLIIGIMIFFMRKAQGGGGMMAFTKNKANREVPNVKFKDVAGADEAKAQCIKLVNYLRDVPGYMRLGGKAPKGILMVGPPGTGKTLLAKAIAGEANVPFFSISGSDFVEMFVGVGASRVCQRARAAAAARW